MGEMQSFEIRRMVTVDGRPHQLGHRLIGSFDVIVGPVSITGCGLVEEPDRTIRVTWPFGKTSYGRKFAANIRDETLAAAVTKRAAEVYELLTGRKIGAVVPRGVVSDFGP